jgi:sporulation protein YlmC with PRC-barrel domain
LLKVEDIIGDEVLSADAKVVGTVDGIGVDTEGWKGMVLRIQVTKGMEDLLGVKKPLFGAARFYFQVTYVENIAHVVTLSRNADALKEISVDGSLVHTMAGDILLKMIVSSNGEQIGTVDELYFDEKRNWSMPYVQTKLTKELRKAWKDRKLKAGLVKIPTVQVRTVGDVVMLDVTTQQLKDIIEHSPG